MRRSRIVAAVVLLAACSGPAADTRAPAAPPRTDQTTWQLTYLKALPGAPVDSLARFISLNWFAMDADAVRAGDLEAYHLLRGGASDTTWDLLEVAIFRDSLQHARSDSLWRVRYRPAHPTVPVGGRDLPALGRIVRTEVVRGIVGAR